MSIQPAERTGAAFYEDNNAHLRDELRKLDLLLGKRAAVFRTEMQSAAGAATLQIACITHEEINHLLNAERLEAEEPGLVDLQAEIDSLQAQIDERVESSLQRGMFLALPRLATLFDLSLFEVQVLVLCLAPELHRKYDKVYAYLQDDITRKRPSIDLVLQVLLSKEVDRWRARDCFSHDAPLVRSPLLNKLEDRQSPSGSSDLATFLQLDDRILGFLLGSQAVDGRLGDLVEWLEPLTLETVPVAASCKMELVRLLDTHLSTSNRERTPILIHLRGPRGSGKRRLAAGLSEPLGRPLLYLDLELLFEGNSELSDVLKLAFREAWLNQTALYLDNADRFLTSTDQAAAKRLVNLSGAWGWLTFVAGNKPWQPPRPANATLFHGVELPIPDAALRVDLWRHVFNGTGNKVASDWATTLGRRFQLTPGQILAAAKQTDNLRVMSNREVQISDFYRACRDQSQQNLGELAVKLEPGYDWTDLILPNDKVLHLKEICAQAKNQYQVFTEWGFGKRFSYGKGLSMLFHGPSGTGKTMAAEVIADELQLDLYKIDLSGVVSKYIGETERNLSKIFKEAECSNAILFFDEADALFGKRTQVSDAHDRYANIETSYLLQKMEEYEGVVILATNLRENMDDAFVRRIRFTVEFPFPDIESRLKIWRKHVTPEAPVDAGVDYEMLSSRFEMAGGNIRNIVLNAAFLASEDGSDIQMKHFLHGTRREYEKMGKLWHEAKLRGVLHD